MEWFLVAATPAALLVWTLYRRWRYRNSIDLQDDITEWSDPVWDRVVNEAGREYLISTAISHGVNNAEHLDNHSLVCLIRKKIVSH